MTADGLPVQAWQAMARGVLGLPLDPFAAPWAVLDGRGGRRRPLVDEDQDQDQEPGPGTDPARRPGPGNPGS